MRFTSSALVALPAILLASSSAFTAVVANDCTCPSDNGSGNNGNGNGGGQQYWGPKPIKYVPKVEATKENLSNGAAEAVKQLTNSNLVPPSVAEPIKQAINDAIKKHTHKVVRVKAEQSGVTTTFTVTPSATVVPTTITVNNNGSVSTAYVTQTITAMPPGATILSNETIEALDNIQDAIRDAVASVDLSKTGLDAATQAELQTCLNAVLQNGGLPAGYSCISQYGSTSSGLKSTFNNILEQFLGILPAKIIDEIQDAVMPMLTDLLPDESTLLDNINSAISSVIASLSGNSVTAISMMQSCYSLAIKQNSNTSYLQCYMSDGGPYDTLNTAMNSVIQQFVGYLPGTLLDSVKNLTSSTLQAGAYGDVSSIGSNLTSQLDAALASVTSSLTGNSVTLMQELQACASKLLKDGDAEAAKNCIAGSPAATARTMVNSVAEQFSGYLPSAFFSDLVSIISNMTATGEYSKTQLITALDQAFNNANIGPAYVGCFEQVQTCVLEGIQSTGNYSSTCAGPVAGCELIGSQNSTTLANTTAAADVPAVADNTTALPTDESAASANTTVLSTDAEVNATSSALPTDAAARVTSSELPTEVASSSEAAESSAASSSSVFEDASAIDATQPTQRLRARRAHNKLRLMYNERYQRL